MTTVQRMQSEVERRPEWDRLLLACQRNLPDTIKKLISVEKIPPSHANAVGQSALHVAALWAHVECVKILLEFGANVHATNTITGATPLHCCVQSSKGTLENRKTCVELLLQFGANANMGDFYGSIPYDYLDKEDEVPPQDRQLHLQIQNLIQPNAPSPIFEIIQNINAPDGVPQLQDLLQDTSDNNDSSLLVSRHKGLTPFLYLVHDICDNEDDDDDHFDKKFQALHLLLDYAASTNCMREVVSATPTQERGGHFSLPGSQQQEPVNGVLHCLCMALVNAYRYKNQPRIDALTNAITKICTHGNIDLKSLVQKETHAILHDAARRNWMGLLKLGVEVLKIDPNATNRQGMTPLQFAARSGQVETCQYLLSLPNVDVLAQDQRGQTALQAAQANNRTEIVNLLQDCLDSKPVTAQE